VRTSPVEFDSPGEHYSAKYTWRRPLCRVRVASRTETSAEAEGEAPLCRLMSVGYPRDRRARLVWSRYRRAGTGPGAMRGWAPPDRLTDPRRNLPPTTSPRPHGLICPALARIISLMNEFDIFAAIGEEGFARLVAEFYRQVPHDE